MLDRVVIVLMALLIVPDAYIYTMYVRRWTGSWWKRLLFFLPSVILLIYFLAVWSVDDFRAEHQPAVGTLMTIFLVITSPKMLFTLIDAIGLGSKHLSAHVRQNRLRQSEDISEAEADKLPNELHRYIRLLAMAVGISSAFIILYGYFFGRRQFQVDQQSIYFKDLPEQFDGYRILHFSDLHIGTYGDGCQRDVESIADLINSQHCDMVVFTGDLVNYESAELEGYTKWLKKIKAKDGVYSVLGNHDYDMYLPFNSAEEKKADMAKIRQYERQYGWHLLLNDNHIIRRGNDSIAVIGSENDGLPPWPARGDLHKASRRLTGIERSDTASTDRHTFSVLLTHDPTHWRRNVIPDTRIDLTLSGHTHAGQFKIMGWSPVSHKYSEWSGVYTEGTQVINVTDGIGQIMLPFRFGAWPEIDIITLKKLKE